MNGDFIPSWSTNHIWRDDDMERCVTLDLEDIEADISALQSGKASTTHTHSYNDLTNKPTTLPANGGNADTVDGKHASDFALASDLSSKANTIHTHAISDVTDLSTNLAAKYVKPSTGIPKTDLASDVQSSLGKADAALQSYTETDPTVPAWAKAASKPSYTATEVGALPNTTTLADLTGDATHRTVTDVEKTAWNAKSTFSGSYNDLTDKPTIPSTDGLATTSYVDTQVATKVSQVEGKGLSTNDYTTAEKTKLAGIAIEANKTVIDSALSSTSTNPVQNKVINSALAGKADANHVHNVFSSLTDIGITTFPTTMKLVSEAMPANSMIVIDTRRINGTNNTYNTETISDWGTTLNGVALICKGVSTARVTMLIMYGTTTATDAQIVYGNYAHDADRVNWDDLDEQLDGKVDKISKLTAVDLNTIMKTGLYYVSSETTALHCPAGTNGHMLVMSDGTRVRQVFFRVGTVDTNSFQWYSRHLGSDLTVGDNGWSKWWLLSGCELAWSGTAALNAEINLGSRYGCQAWVVAGQVTDTGTYSTVYIPRYFLTTNTTQRKFQIADETGYVSFYFYYKINDDNVYAKVVWVSDANNSALKYVYRVS